MPDHIHFSLSELIDPATEPVTTAEQKSWINVDISSDDTMIDSMIATARLQVESWTRRKYVATMIRQTMDKFPNGSEAIILRRAPLLYVKRIQYIDEDGATQTWGDAQMEIRVTPANVEDTDVFSILAAGVAIATDTATAATVANVTGLLETAWNAATSAYATYITATDQTTYLELKGDTAGEGFAVTTSTTDGGGADAQTLVASTTNDESTLYSVDATSLLARIEPFAGSSSVGSQDYPDTNPDRNAVWIDYVAGYGAASAVPDIAKTAIKMIAADLYEHRESQSEIRIESNQAVKDLLWPLRIVTAP